MMKNFVISLVVLTGSALAQTTVTTTGGTTNSVPKFSGSSTLVNSSITESSGNVGIGAATPGAKLDVAGTMKLSGTGSTLTFPDGTVQSTAWTGNTGAAIHVSAYPNPTDQGAYLGWNALTGGTGETDFINNQGAGTGGFAFMNTPDSGSPRSTLMFIDGTGSVGIGTTSPQGKLDVVEQPNQRLFFGGNANGWYPGAASIVAVNGNNTAHVPFAMYASQYAFGGGNFGIGTINPSAALEVNGSMKLTAGSGASITFPDNTIQATAWNGTTSGGDYAEAVDVLGERNGYEPGDVLAIDKESPTNFRKASEPYSRRVAGIYSTKPGLLGRRKEADPTLTATTVPMALVGIVPTKVTAENGAIEPGDLLVTSSREGYAMKGTDPTKMMGAVIGKAMGNLDSGSGVIEVLVSLQ